MKDSIVIDMRYAGYDMIDGTPNVHRHHIFEGTANRRLSDEDGLWVPLSYEHHEGNMSVHRNKEMSVLMHIIGQLAWEKHYIAGNADVNEADAREASFPEEIWKKLFVIIPALRSRGKDMPVNIEQKTLTSVEVAEMVGKDHHKLLRDIRNYIDQLNQSKIGFVDFFTESNYKDGKGETRPCYLVTKKGCEFIAHKLTGVKGTEFTAKYINRFHEMEETIQRPRTALEQIALLAQGALELEEKVDSVEHEVYSIKNDMPLFGAESDELSAHVKRKGVEMLGGKKSEAYKDNKVRQTVYRDIYSQLKREFGIYDEDGKTKSYKALKRKDLADAHEFIDCYTLPAYLQDVIAGCNAQIRMDGDSCGV